MQAGKKLYLLSHGGKMLDLFDFINNNKLFRQYKVNDILFVEYKCVADEPAVKVWSRHNYFLYVLRGKKMWGTSRAQYCVEKGEAIFVKKGANIIHQFFEEGFCSLMIFIPDQFITDVIKGNPIVFPKCMVGNTDTVIPLQLDEVLSTYFDSLLSYFAKSQHPPTSLLEIKFKELILDLVSSPRNEMLCGYFKSLCDQNKSSIREVMETNFIYNMKLEEFAFLSGRSLTSFKRDFISTFNCTPGKWLLNRRLEHAKYLLEVTDKNINELAFESGFDNSSHFIKVFRKAYNVSPLKFRKSLLKSWNHQITN